MKQILNSIIIFSLMLTTFALSSCNSSGTVKSNSADVVLENIATRTSIRAFSGESIDDETITKILKAGMAAPTAVNSQPWVFYVVKDRALMEQVAENFPNAKMSKNASILVIPCGNREKFLKGGAEGFWIQDLSAATENILLAAHALGLGAVWTGLYPNTQRVKDAAELIGIDSRHIPLCIIPIGIPAESPEPKDKWNPESVFYK